MRTVQPRAIQALLSLQAFSESLSGLSLPARKRQELPHAKGGLLGKRKEKKMRAKGESQMSKLSALMQYIMARNEWSVQQMHEAIERYAHVWVQCVHMAVRNHHDLQYVADTFHAGCAYHDLDMGM